MGNRTDASRQHRGFFWGTILLPPPSLNASAHRLHEAHAGVRYNPIAETGDFAKDASRNANYYYDEDGMGLKINEYQTGCYRISDDKNNEMFFVNGIQNSSAVRV